MSTRKIEDKLREEYFKLLPDICKVKEQLEAEIKYNLIPIANNLKSHQRLSVISRIKECESAIDALCRRQEGRLFNEEKQYSLKDLKDLAGVRILLFPRSLDNSVSEIIKKNYQDWVADPMPGFSDNDCPIALKYHGYCSASINIPSEIQIVPMLTGLFWEVEHKALYKPKSEFKAVKESLEMREQTQKVLTALSEFENEFERIIKDSNNAE